MIVDVLAYLFMSALLLSTLAVIYSLTRFFCVWVAKKTESIDLEKKKD